VEEEARRSEAEEALVVSFKPLTRSSLRALTALL